MRPNTWKAEFARINAEIAQREGFLARPTCSEEGRRLQTKLIHDLQEHRAKLDAKRKALGRSMSHRMPDWRFVTPTHETQD
jgi:hypothetical protein